MVMPNGFTQIRISFQVESDKSDYTKKVVHLLDERGHFISDWYFLIAQ